MNKTLLDALFQPQSIAVVGASTKPGKIGYTVTERLIKDGYKGAIYPINPGASELLGLKVYP
ncbi:MAG: acetyl CoA synthetase, partial [Anaerolineae bacterium]|nr:acetyl CoA synthetase [Anaerolineae bacterium]NPV87235.1 acetyl CoA synthetase [Anaerolineae bacterium]